MRSKSGQDALPGLVDQALIDEAEALAAEARRRRAAILAVREVLGKGPIEQKAWKTVRRATAAGRFSSEKPTADPDLDAGLLEAYEQCAAAIDQAMGHNLTGSYDRGQQLGALLEQYVKMHAAITGKAATPDGWNEFLEEVNYVSAGSTPHSAL